MSLHIEFDLFDSDSRDFIHHPEKATPDQKAILSLLQICNDDYGIFINIDEISPRALELVEWVIDFTLYQKNYEKEFQELQLKKYQKYATVHKNKYITIWSFIYDFLKIEADSTYDYILMHFLDEHEITEYGCGIRCGWFNSGYSNPYNNRQLTEERRQIIKNWVKNAADDITIYAYGSEHIKKVKAKKAEIRELLQNPPNILEPLKYAKWVAKLLIDIDDNLLRDDTVIKHDVNETVMTNPIPGMKDKKLKEIISQYYWKYKNENMKKELHDSYTSLAKSLMSDLSEYPENDNQEDIDVFFKNRHRLRKYANELLDCELKEKIKEIVTKSQVPGMPDEEYQAKLNTYT